MKKLMLASVVLALPMMAQAENYSAAGCGLGSMLFEGKTGLGPHIFAATTNNIYGTQTFAMSSGTLGCNVDGTIVSHASLYVDSNMDQIAVDMSRGQGEALDALAAVLGVQKEDQAVFRQVMQQNFSTIFSSESVSSAEVVDGVVTAMKGNASLSKYVS